MPRWWFVTLLAVGVAGALVARAADTPVERRDRREPGLILETGARMGACDVLTFTPDGNYLLAAGDDKVVRIWQVTPEGLELHNTLRWSTWREQRGAIYALALSPDRDSRQVAIGGMGVRTGSVVVLDRITGNVVHALTNVAGNDQVVWTLAFSPSGRQIVFGTNDGSVWLWDLAGEGSQAAVKLGRHRGRHAANPVRLVAFRGPTQLVSVAQDGEVLAWNTGDLEAAPLPLVHFRCRDLFRVAISPDRKWLAGAGQDRGDNLELVSLNGAERELLPLAGDDLPHSLAFDPQGERLAVGVRTVPEHAAFFKETDDKVVVYDLGHVPARRQGGPKPTFHAEALAFHPDGTRLAVAGGNNHEVTLWDLHALTRGPVGEARSPGSCLWGVGLSADGRYFGYQEQRARDPRSPNQRGKGPWTVFDLRRRQWARVRDFQPLAPRESLGGWTVRPSRQDAYVWDVESPEGKLFPLPLNRTSDGIPRCYTFLRPAAGRGIRLAVGHYWGISIFELDAAGPRRVRLFTGHQDYVTAVAASADQTVLVSASRDQTVAAWSLADWPSQAELGAACATRLGKVFVDRVDPGSPAWEAGLARGDEIVLFAFDRNRFLFDPENQIGQAQRVQRRIEQTGDAEECLARLCRPVPGRQFYFRVRREGYRQPLELATTVRQHPLWRFFGTRGGEWVLWRGQDYYYDASAQGDSLIGWQVSGDVDQKPEFYEAAQFRERFHRPDKVADVIEHPQTAPDRVSIPEIEPPDLRLAVDTTEVSTAPVTVRLTATPRGEREVQRPERLALWIGDYRYREWRHADLPADSVFQAEVRLPAHLLRTGPNRLTFEGQSRAGTGARPRQVIVVKKGPRPRPTLFVLLVGVSDYGKAKPWPGGSAIEPLPGVKVDVLELADLWAGQKGKLYREVRVATLEDEKATPDAIRRRLRAIAAQAGPDDRLVLYLGGHGYSEAVGRGTAFKPGTFVFAGPTFDFRQATATGLTSDELYRLLSSIRCRKLVLLNACHAGDATVRTLREPVRELTPAGVGPIVLSACEHKEPSFLDEEGSLFAQAVVEALGDHFRDADRNRNNELDTLELAQYVRRRVPELLAESRRDGKVKEKDRARSQTPCYYPGPKTMERFVLAQK